MKLLLVNPPYSRLRGVGQAPYFPLGLGCLARAVSSQVDAVRILNLENPAQGEPLFPIDKETVFRFRSHAYSAMQAAIKDPERRVWKEFNEILSKFQPDLIGITVMTVDVGAAVVLSKLAHRWRKKITVLWGGVHPTFEPEASLNEECVDFLIRGEGETSLNEFCNQFKSEKPSWSDVPGLSYFQNGVAHHNPLPPLITDLDSCFPPLRDKDFFSERYSSSAWGSIMASRGCPWKCTFCSSPVFWRRRLRYRSIENVGDEIEDMVSSGLTKHFTFWDDSFSANHKKVTELCNMIISRNLKITWKTATRIDLIEDELLELMKNAGCIQLQIGIETGSPRMAKLLKKEVNPNDSIQAVQKIKMHGIGSGVFFMAGFPQETIRDLKETFSLMQKLPTDEIVLNVFDPMPGSEIFEEMKRTKLLAEKNNWNNFPLWPDKYFINNIDKDEFDSFVEEMSAWIFHNNNRLSLKWSKNKNLVLFLLKYDPFFLINKFKWYSGLKIHKFLQKINPKANLNQFIVSIGKWIFWRSGLEFGNLLSISFLHRLGNIAGSLLFHLDKRRRELIASELTNMLPNKLSNDKLMEEVKISFTNFASELLETFHFPKFNKDKIKKHIKLEGAEYLTEALKKKKGVILLTAHFGAHLMPILALKPLNLDIYQLGTPPAAWEKMIGKKLTCFEKDVFSVRHNLEKSLPVTFIFLNDSLRDVFRILNKNGVLIVAFDGRGGTKWEKVSFMDEIFLLSPGAFHLAYSSEAPILPTITVREGDKNVVKIHPPILLNKKFPKKEETERGISEFLKVFEYYFTNYPGHYGWLLQAAHIRAKHDQYPLILSKQQ